jgi:hypothetical protein
MAFPDPFLVKNVAAADQTYTRRGPIPQGNLYVDVLASPAARYFVALRSILTPRKAGVPGSMRNIVTFGLDITDSDDNVHTTSLAMSLVRPSVTDVSDAHVDDLFARLADFNLRDSKAYQTRFIRGEI